MAISEERFKVEDNEFDLPIADFLSILDTGIRNFLENLLDVFPDLVIDLIDDITDNDDDKDRDYGRGTILPNYPIPVTDSQLNFFIDKLNSEITARGIKEPKGPYFDLLLDVMRKYLTGSFSNKYNIKTTRQLFKTTDQLIEQYNYWRQNLNTQYVHYTGYIDFTEINDVDLNEAALQGMEIVAKELKNIDPEGYSNILNSSIALLTPTTTITDNKTVSTIEDPDSIKAYSEMVNKLTNGKYNLINNDSSVNDNIELDNDYNGERMVVSVTKEPGSIKAYSKMVNKLTNGEYNLINNDSSVNDNIKLDNDYNVERIVVSVTKEAANKNIYGVFTAFGKKYGNSRAMVNAGIKLIYFARNSKKDKLLFELLSNPVAVNISNIDMSTGMLLNQLNIDPNTGEQYYSELYNKMTDSLNIIDTDWNMFTSGDRDFISAANLNNSNKDVLSILLAESLNNETSVHNSTLNTEAYLYTATQFNASVAINE